MPTLKEPLRSVTPATPVDADTPAAAAAAACVVSAISVTTPLALPTDISITIHNHATAASNPVWALTSQATSGGASQSFDPPLYLSAGCWVVVVGVNAVGYVAVELVT